ncbi:MAG: protein-methionine-sulfoxide reductase catalytic subunit MsrP [Methylobacter sp.]|nr:MAG: protein-methionine-sulfoxide reductase catalytic subunit MsrP [Methylobacter sp.]PPD03555.1 MAG: protein-methionine-sulfoxide reductase catalytic subunit MsrP [Methylobacter sp.]PPD20834.1 MAG: protein-methionine-sulfoxide reductase catalytic subunit MsrP [Methylobacter sp.]PPD36543.1 MAG: protein-methionine-sulfoxide reductase catalytic subunit MsrP [Methylomonas sp.]
MYIKTDKTLPASEITDPAIFSRRRQIIKTLIAGAATFATTSAIAKEQAFSGNTAANLLPTPAELVENYNNYYEFSVDKAKIKTLAQAFNTDPWSVEVTGEVEKPGRFALDSILSRFPSEERIYRFRCVEAWSMVVPWQGFELRRLLNWVKPLSSAKFVKFTSVLSPEAMPMQKANAVLSWPYVEALRLDEAMHALTILATGIYGEPLPKQNGAPLRLVVPWKYGFKSIKAIVKIELLSHAPRTSWNLYAPEQYGFYANVNPLVPHPRWSQSSEHLLGSDLFTPRRQTEAFNGYGEHVAAMYSGMDLRHFY